MIVGYFGCPGAGKTSLLTKFAVKSIKNQKRSQWYCRLFKKRVYDHIYSNFYCEGAEVIDFNDLDKFKMYNSLILLDELAMEADNRNFKNFPIGIRDFFVLHRHFHCDIIYATQSYDAVDKKIKFLTQELWYMSKSVVPLLSSFTTARRIYRNININEHTSELTMGYRFCNFIEALFVRNLQICYRKPLYKYFDSFDECQLADRTEFKSYKWGSKPPIKDETISFDELSDIDIDFIDLDLVGSATPIPLSDDTLFNFLQ